MRFAKIGWDDFLTSAIIMFQDKYQKEADGKSASLIFMSLF